MNNFKIEQKRLKEDMSIAFNRVLESGWYVLGPEVQTFEKKWAEHCGVKYCIAVGNGLDALVIGMLAIGIGKGDEVVTTPMTAFATVLAIIRCGAIPVLADIDPQTAIIDTNSIERCLSKNTKAIMIVHLYGQVCNIDTIINICNKNNIHFIEDCAQAHLSKYNGKIVGGFGSFGGWSFYPTKNLGAIGDAGAITTNNKLFAEKASSLRNYGQTKKYHHPNIGINSRMDELQAALLLVRLKYLDEWTQKRQKIASYYYKNINNNKVTLLRSPNMEENHVFHLFVIMSEQRKKLQKYLERNGISTLIHYPIPIHKQKSCLNIKTDPNGLINSERHATNCLSIPCYPNLQENDVQHIIDSINRF